MASSSFAATPSCLLTDRERVIGELTRGCVFADKLRLVLRGAAVDGGTSADDLLGRIVHTFTQSISMLCAGSDSDEVYQVPAVVNSPVLKTEDSRESCKSPASKDRRGCYKRMNLQIKKQDKKRYVVSIRGIDLSIKKEIFTGGVNEDGVEIPTCTIDLDDEETDTESVDDRYKKATADSASVYTTQEINAQFYQQESKKLRQQIQMIENSNRHLMGDGLSSLNVKEMKQLESRLERGITRIRAKKHELILAETECLQKREVQLEQENACLRAKIQESDRLQQLSIMPGGQEYAFQAYLARNGLQLNMMESVSPYPVSDKKDLHLGY